jgi:hypothetical protein
LAGVFVSGAVQQGKMNAARAGGTRGELDSAIAALNEVQRRKMAAAKK